MDAENVVNIEFVSPKGLRISLPKRRERNLIIGTIICFFSIAIGIIFFLFIGSTWQDKGEISDWVFLIRVVILFLIFAPSIISFIILMKLISRFLKSRLRFDNPEYVVQQFYKELRGTEEAYCYLTEEATREFLADTSCWLSLHEHQYRLANMSFDREEHVKFSSSIDIFKDYWDWFDQKHIEHATHLYGTPVTGKWIYLDEIHLIKQEENTATFALQFGCQQSVFDGNRTEERRSYNKIKETVTLKKINEEWLLTNGKLSTTTLVSFGYPTTFAGRIRHSFFEELSDEAQKRLEQIEKQESERIAAERGVFQAAQRKLEEKKKKE